MDSTMALILLLCPIGDLHFDDTVFSTVGRYSINFL